MYFLLSILLLLGINVLFFGLYVTKAFDDKLYTYIYEYISEWNLSYLIIFVRTWLRRVKKFSSVYISVTSIHHVSKLRFLL